MNDKKNLASSQQTCQSYPIKIALILQVLLILACSAPFLKKNASEDQPVLEDKEVTPIVVGDPSTLGSDQLLILEEFGWPHSFTIMEVNGKDNGSVRYETWNYYDGGISYIFFDGVFQFYEHEEVIMNDLIATPYQPDAFDLGQSLEEIRAHYPNIQWTSLDIPDEIDEGIKFYVSELIMLGFYKDRLISVSALAFEPDNGGAE